MELLRIDPDERDRFGFDWRAIGWLDDDETITDARLDVDPETGAITLEPDTVVIDNDLGQVSYWLRDGVAGATCTITNHIETSAGRKGDWSVVVSVGNR